MPGSEAHFYWCASLLSSEVEVTLREKFEDPKVEP